MKTPASEETKEGAKKSPGGAKVKTRVQNLFNNQKLEKITRQPNRPRRAVTSGRKSRVR